MGRQLTRQSSDETGEAVVVTDSESLFSHYCDANAIPCTRIRRSSQRTPDYRIRLQATDVVCEVKQLNMSDVETAAWKEAVARGTGGHFVKNRLRSKVADASSQLESDSVAGTPTVVVVFDNTPFAGELGHESVTQALYGTIRYPVIASGDEEPALGDPFLDGDGAFDSPENSTVSALAVLEDVRGSVRLCVYHNLRAAVPLDPELLRCLPVEQVVLPGDTSIDVEA